MVILVVLLKSPRQTWTAAICGRPLRQQTHQNRDAALVMHHMLKNRVWNLMMS